MSASTHVHRLLTRNLPGRASHPVLRLGGASVDYAELDRRVEGLAARLFEAGVRPGDRVAIHLRKGIEEVVATLAVARIDGVFVNVNQQWTPHQLEYVLGHCEPLVLVTEARRQADLETIDTDSLRRVLVVGGPAEHVLAAPYDDRLGDGAAPPPAAAPDALAALLYTSGSTGRPKGVMLSHQNVVDGAEIVAGYLGNARDDRLLGFLPMSFDYGMSQLTTMLSVGGTLVLQPVMMPAEVVRTVQSEGVTGLALVPPAWVQLVRLLEDSGERLPSLRYVTNSGGKIPDKILDAMPRVLPGVDIVLMYGLTEAFRSTYLPPELFETKRGSMGRAIPGVEIHVVHPEGGRCGPGETGELVHRGKLVSQGYWRDPEATARRIRPCPALGTGAEPVVWSGDLVRMDADGYLWFEGRDDEQIKCSGHRLSPTEVEEAVHASGLVTDVVAFGVPDEDLGQVVHVAVSSRGGPLDEEALAAHCRRALPSYMVPRRIHAFVGDLPRTGSGKLDRPAVVRACTTSSAPRIDPPHSDPE